MAALSLSLLMDDRDRLKEIRPQLPTSKLHHFRHQESDLLPIELVGFRNVVLVPKTFRKGREDIGLSYVCRHVNTQIPE